MTTPIYTYLEKRTQNFLKKANIIHGYRYDYSEVRYIGSKAYVNIICSTHGEFEQEPRNHLSGQGCPICGKEERDNKKNSNVEEFKKKSDIIHNNFYDYSDVKYIKSSILVEIICPVHGSFPQIPKSHLSGHGCPACSNMGYSKIAIKWLNSIDPNIQHAENGGEYTIPNTNYRVDGYCKETSTIYEFHGDKFHGNPKVYNSDDQCHPFDKEITAKELYDKTIEREEEIKSLGYNLVVMWENDYIN